MANCPNCKSKLNCSCKLRKASDQKQCCVNCVTQYNKLLIAKGKRTADNTPGVIINTTAVQKE